MQLDLIIHLIESTIFIDLFFARMDLHQISRFLSADEYERLIYNHRR